ncbi:hypothetical protein JHK87_028092 [Glycine soja]|nr:hypothetical protein JHK87_028092 [Glycine soja]
MTIQGVVCKTKECSFTTYVSRVVAGSEIPAVGNNVVATRPEIQATGYEIPTEKEKTCSASSMKDIDKEKDFLENCTPAELLIKIVNQKMVNQKKNKEGQRNEVFISVSKHVKENKLGVDVWWTILIRVSWMYLLSG